MQCALSCHEYVVGVNPAQRWYPLGESETRLARVHREWWFASRASEAEVPYDGGEMRTEVLLMVVENLPPRVAMPFLGSLAFVFATKGSVSYAESEAQQSR